MCGRYTLATPNPADVRARFPAISESIEIRRRYNVAPGDDVLAVVMRDGGPTGALLRWGLVPPWAEDPSVGFRMINARAETVADKPAYRNAFLRGRCLIVADGFYEWQREGARQPFHVTRAHGEPFAFAGIRTAWHDPRAPEGELLRSCAIVTTAANAVVQHIHPRMPVILDPTDEEEWLDPGTPPMRLHAMLHPLADDLTDARPVSKAVNDARYDGPECLAPPAPAPQGELF